MKTQLIRTFFLGTALSFALPLMAADIAIFVECVQEKPVANKMVDGTASDMSKQIAATGSVNLYGIYFDTNKTDVKPESKPTLDEVGKLMASDATLKLKVVGHTDNVGTADYNNDLSMRRAQSVMHELVASYSVAPERLTPFGAGFTQPIATNDTDDGRAKNRRVELVKL
jgi:OOP family OmpA-OmpF porin